jgi:uncharacterized protein with PIN domain
MDAEFVLTLASQSWLKWFSCPHCGSDCPTSRNGRCTQCDAQLVLVRNQTVESDVLNGFSRKLDSLIPLRTGSSNYYHDQWNRLVNPITERDSPLN